MADILALILIIMGFYFLYDIHSLVKEMHHYVSFFDGK